MVAMDQVTRPLAESRDGYSIFTERRGAGERFTEGRDADGWLRRMYEDCIPRAARAGVTLPSYDVLQQAGIIDYTEVAAPTRRRIRSSPPSAGSRSSPKRSQGSACPIAPAPPVWREPAEWLGAAATARFPLHMISDQPSRRLHSQLDHRPHSQAGKTHGRERVTISPADAAAR